jgi:hypothetical protein
MAKRRPGESADQVRRLIGLFEKMNVDEAIKMFTEDCRYRFGNYPAAKGREGVRQSATSSHLTAIKGCTFDIQGLWEFDGGDVVVCQMEINYIRTDDSVLTLPCTDVFRMEGALIQDMRIYMDPSPLFK